MLYYYSDKDNALFGKRTGTKDSNDPYSNIEVSYLMQRIEDYVGGLPMLAMNKKRAVDEAYFRLLRFIVKFNLPKFKQRKKVWQLIFRILCHAKV